MWKMVSYMHIPRTGFISCGISCIFFLLYHCNSYDSNLGSVNREILNVRVSSLIRGKDKFKTNMDFLWCSIK